MGELRKLKHPSRDPWKKTNTTQNTLDNEIQPRNVTEKECKGLISETSPAMEKGQKSTIGWQIEDDSTAGKSGS